MRLWRSDVTSINTVSLVKTRKELNMPGVLELIFIVVILCLVVVPFWKICGKAGFPPALALLTLVPVVNFILLLYIAFADWPALKGRKGVDEL
jgi:hypothetical protein